MLLCVRTYVNKVQTFMPIEVLRVVWIINHRELESTEFMYMYAQSWQQILDCADIQARDPSPINVTSRKGLCSFAYLCAASHQQCGANRVQQLYQTQPSANLLSWSIDRPFSCSISMPSRCWMTSYPRRRHRKHCRRRRVWAGRLSRTMKADP